MKTKQNKTLRKRLIKNMAKEAGNELMSLFRKDKKLITLRGSSKEIVTKYDKIIDKLIIKRIKEHFPKDNILTEESGSLKGNSEFLWIVDSLDGTGNFANQNPLFSVCIALLEKKKLLFGAIYAPTIKEFYFAEKGKGAFLNSKPIQVSKIKSLKSSYLFYCEGGENNRLRTKKIISALYPKVADIRKIGSAGIEIAWLAAGRGECFWTTRIDPWDIAAGVLLIREAGGKVTDFKGNPWQVKKSDFLFSNGKIDDQILKLVKGK